MNKLQKNEVNKKATLLSNLPMGSYLNMKDYLSGSMLTEVLNRADKYNLFYIKGEEKRSSENLLIGSLTHTMVLEPDKLFEEYHLIPSTYIGPNGSEKKWIDNKEYPHVKEDIIKADGKIRINKKQYNEARTYAIHIKADDMTKSFLNKKGFAEATILYDSGDLKFKSRPDYLIPKEDIAINVKTAKSANPIDFQKNAISFGYDISAALTAKCYEKCFGRPLKDYIFIVLEKETPYPVEIYTSKDPMFDDSDMNFLQFGAIRLELAIGKYKSCMDNKIWLPYDDGPEKTIKIMRSPRWELDKYIDDSLDLI